jgi:hypothetical protein
VGDWKNLNVNREIRVESRIHFRFHYLPPEPVTRQNNKSEIVDRVSQFPIIVDFGAFMPSLYGTKTKKEMDNYSAIYTFLWLSPSLYKQKQIWCHFCWPPTPDCTTDTRTLSPTKMYFIFVGFPGQQKWKQFWRFHHLAKFALLHFFLRQRFYVGTTTCFPFD